GAAFELRKIPVCQSGARAPHSKFRRSSRMSARKNPLFVAALTICALVALAEGWFIYERYSASKAAEKSAAEKRGELAGMSALNPPPTRAVAAAIEADLARAQRALAAMQVELKGRGPAAERMAKARVPAARTDAF